MKRLLRNLLLVFLVGVAAYVAWIYRPVSPAPWNDTDLELLRSFWADGNRAVATDVERDHELAHVVGDVGMVDEDLGFIFQATECG